MPPIQAQPRSQELQYIMALRRIWGMAQGVVSESLEPLLRLWPVEDGFSADSDRWSSISTSGVLHWETMDEDQVSLLYFDATARDRYNPLLPHPRPRHISTMTNADIKAVWPNFNPEDIRRYAPWATAKGEVIRLVYPGQNPSSQDIDIYLQRAIAAGKVGRPLPTVETFVPNPPGPGAFIARPRRFPPPVIGPDGFPMIPPIPPEVTVATIQRQFEHINVVLGEMLTDQNIDEVIAPMGGKINRFTTKEVGRVLNINLRKENPQIQGAIDQWRDLNVSLIKNGTSDFYNDISRVVEDAHMRGLRVEVLARTIQDRYGVSDSRAALIARDQTLKLNGQITRGRQQQAGITHYRWITSKDERVREEHQELDGTIRSWNDPHPTEGHPGDSFQCRCVSSPIIKGIDNE